MKEIKVGLIGFGTVGSGVGRILQKNSRLIEKRLGAKLTLKRIADIDLETDRGVKLKPGVLTRRADDVIKDPEIDIVMELMGGTEPAKTFILKAIRNSKHIVTANKALLALHGDEIFKRSSSVWCRCQLRSVRRGWHSTHSLDQGRFSGQPNPFDFRNSKRDL